MKWLAALIIAALPIQSHAATLHVEVEGITGAGGQLRVGLWDAATFASPKPLHGSVQTAKPGGLIVTFANVEPGDYAVKAFQDVNANGRADKNFLGIPTEPFGFSNAPRLLTHAPSFDEAKFAVHAGDNVVVIRLR